MDKKEVSREEFEALKEKVNNLEKTTDLQTGLLQEIDKKIDVINEKVSSSAEIGDLKIKPIEDRVDKLEDSNKWVWRAVASALIGVVVTGFFAIKNIGG